MAKRRNVKISREAAVTITRYALKHETLVYFALASKAQKLRKHADGGSSLPRWRRYLNIGGSKVVREDNIANLGKELAKSVLETLDLDAERQGLDDEEHLVRVRQSWKASLAV